MTSSSNQVVTISTISTQKPLVDARLQALIFSYLTADGTNLLEWVNNAKVTLAAEELSVFLSKDTAKGRHDVLKGQTLFFLQRHLDPSLRQQYIQVNHPVDLWTELHDKFHHKQTIFLPEAKNDWINLRVLDFLDFLFFNSELHCITAQLRLCDEQVIESKFTNKTLSTFPPTVAILAQEYRNMKFTKHNKLMSHLLLAEKHQHILLKNIEARPAREIHAMISTRPPAVHISEASHRSPRGFKHRPPSRQFKFKPRDHKPRYVPHNHKTSKQSSLSCYKCAAKVIMLGIIKPQRI